MSTAEQQRRPNAQAAITGLVLLVPGAILLLNGVPSLFSSIGSLAQWTAYMGFERALETVMPYLIFPVLMTIAGLLMVRGGFGMLRKQGRKGAQWARSEWQEQQPQVQQRVQSAREQLQSQGGGMWQQAQQRAQQQAPQWAQQQRPGWPGQPQGQGQGQRPPWPGQPTGQQPPPPQASQRRPAPQQQLQRQQSTLERMQQRIAESATAADRARDAAMAKHEQQAAALRERAERSAAHAAAPQYAEPGVSFGSPALVSGRRSSSILASSSLRSTSLGRTSLSLDSLRLRR
ncbi:hypothetical protein [Agrococcus jejuensis]|uniref:Uncharacterized protein n=1 Tax=Agrococcus jejuensis TaxID=399736 RepID=A0A1G8EH13_9MICO|nr:hypothetical protein [Agrococcus jejuensis]SDH69178.1 hypothetical protein SAMN04489720_2037 [Agrococcus jejuensis]